MRQLAAFQKAQPELQRLGCLVVAASTDTLDQAREVAQRHGLTFPIAYGCTREEGETLGAWWSEYRGGHLQPAEFMLGRGGVVLGSMYASGPVGRMAAEEVINAITSRERRRLDQEARNP